MLTSTTKIQMSYNSRLSRVRVEFFASECFAQWRPPRQLLQKVEDKFRQERDEGFIETYLVFGKRFDDFWAHIRNRQNEIAPDRLIKFTLGQGGRIYEEIRLSVQHEDIFLSAEIPSKKMSTISFSSFLFNVMLKLDHLDFSFTPDRAQLKFLYMLLKNGQALTKIPILPGPSAEDNTRRGFALRFHSKERYASLHIFSSEWLQNEDGPRALLREAHDLLQRLNTQNIPLHVLEEHSLEKLHSLKSKVQAFGFQMPYDLLLAYDESYCLSPKLLLPRKAREDSMSLAYVKPRADHLRLNGDFLHFELDKTRMSAKLIAINDRYLKAADTLSLETVEMEFLKAGIRSENASKELFPKLIAGESPLGMIVARGRKAQAGRNQSLIFGGEEIFDQAIDFRERTTTKLVREGALVAEVRYTDGQKGSTVDGREFYAEGSATSLGLIAGEGITLVNDFQFFANRNGIWQLDGQTLSVARTYTHKGSVNFASGNIHFDGSLVIEGDIEAGATVEIEGTLVVKGSIDSAKVRCSGDLEVKGGINSGKQGYVHVGGNARAAFIDNSIVHVKQNLIVDKSITHSLVISGGIVSVVDTEKGVIAGGLTCAWQAIFTAKFGTDHGQITQCRVGSHHRNEVRFQRLASRLKFFEGADEENQRAVHLFDRPGLSSEQQQRLGELKKKAKRFKAILDKVKEQKAKAALSRDANQDATLVVADVLDKNSSVWIAGKKIIVPTSLRGVLLTALTHDGILDLKEAPRFKSQHPNTIIEP